MKKIITIITVCFNSEKTISSTFDSVLMQDYEDFEYIVIDGGSKDKTLSIIQKYEKLFNGKLRYISEKDEGIYDAMNKGIKMSKGDVIGFLYADDKFSKGDVLSKINSIFEEEDCDGVYGDLLFLDNRTMSIPSRKVIAGDYSKKPGWQPPFPTLYLKKEVYDAIGLYNQKYKIAADYDFTIRLTKEDFKLSYIKQFLVYMRTGGISTKGLKGYKENFEESLQVLRDNNVPFPLIYNISRIFRTFWQMFIAKFHKL